MFSVLKDILAFCLGIVLIIIFLYLLWMVIQIIFALLFPNFKNTIKSLWSHLKEKTQVSIQSNGEGKLEEGQHKMHQYLKAIHLIFKNVILKITNFKKEISSLILTLCFIAALFPINTYFQSDRAWKSLSNEGCQQVTIDKFEALALKSNRYIDTTFDVIQGCNFSTENLTLALYNAGNKTNRVRYEKAMDDWDGAYNSIYSREILVEKFRELGAVAEANSVQSEIYDLQKIAQLEKNSDVKLWDDVLKPNSFIDYIPLPQAKGKTLFKGIKKFNRANRAWKSAKAAKNAFRARAKQKRIKKARLLKRKEQLGDYKRCLKESVSERVCRKEFIKRIKID